MNEQNINKNQYIAVFIAIAVMAIMFFGVGILYKIFFSENSEEVGQIKENPEVISKEEPIAEEVKKVEKENINNITYIKGMEIKTLVEGTGEGAKVGDTVFVHYTGKLTDGTVFDSSIPRGQAFDFRLGEGRVIAGWEEGVKGMKIGEKRTLTIPGDMAYGSRGFPNGQGGYLIPPNATLVFDIELLEIK